MKKLGILMVLALAGAVLAVVAPPAPAHASTVCTKNQLTGTWNRYCTFDHNRFSGGRLDGFASWDYTPKTGTYFIDLKDTKVNGRCAYARARYRGDGRETRWFQACGKGTVARFGPYDLNRCACGDGSGEPLYQTGRYLIDVCRSHRPKSCHRVWRQFVNANGPS